MDLWKRSAESANIVSAAIAVYVLVKPQGEAQVSQMPVHAPNNLPLVILCVSVISAAILNFVALRRAPVALIEPGDDALSAGIPNPIFGAPMVLPDGRQIISCTPKDLQKVYSANTIDKTTRLLGGKWVRMSGKIQENHGKGQIWLTENFPFIILRFGESWHEQLSVLPRGSSVTFRGKVANAGSSAIYLEDCELL